MVLSLLVELYYLFYLSDKNTDFGLFFSRTAADGLTEAAGVSSRAGQAGGTTEDRKRNTREKQTLTDQE